MLFLPSSRQSLFRLCRFLMLCALPQHFRSHWFRRKRLGLPHQGLAEIVELVVLRTSR